MADILQLADEIVDTPASPKKNALTELMQVRSQALFSLLWQDSNPEKVKD